MTDHEKYMLAALKEAECALKEGEVPVGCVIVKDGEIVSTGHNRRETIPSALAHAEIEAIDAACRFLNTWRLSGCSLYVTLEPCPMCAGAIINARIDKIYYGAKDDKAGSCGSIINLFLENYNHKPQVTGGILKEACSKILTDFFDGIRKNF